MKQHIWPCLICLVLLISAAFAISSGAVWPEASGDVVLRDSKLTVDASHADDGYVMVRGAENSHRYKLRIAFGEDKLTYDLNSDGAFEIFPLQYGSGRYTITLYQNSSGNKYAAAGSVRIDAALANENAALLVPSQYVSYTAQTSAVALSDEICGSADTDQEKFEAVRRYIMQNFMYDFIKAVTVQPGAMPDIEACVDTRMGICQDLAATAACMLRVQGIPTKLVVGYRGKQYHAWTVVLLDGQEVLYDPTEDLGGTNQGLYAVERFY